MATLIIEDFGIYKNEAVKKYTWTTLSGFSVSIISYGAIVQAIKIPDKYEVVKDIVLGFDDLDSYVNKNTPYLGAVVGRCANRIGRAAFDIDGVTYNVAKNVGENHLHGGVVGFDKVNWVGTHNGNKVVFSHLSKDGDEGYPGYLITNVTYEVRDDNSLYMEFVATTTKTTVVNLTNHTYFNLAGHETGSEELYNHYIAINADRITETDGDCIPTGRLIKVGGTRFDLRIPSKLGDALKKNSELFDDNFCVNTYANKELSVVARVVHPSSGRSLEIHSDQPGVQFYTGNFLPSAADEILLGKNGASYRKHGAFCLETQKYPDAVHHTNFPRTVLYPGEVYRHRVVYSFDVVKDHEASII